LELADKTNSENKEERMKKLDTYYNSARLASEVGYTATTGPMYSNLGVVGIDQGSRTIGTSLIASSTTWIFASVIYTAETGLNYRRMSKGLIKKKEFWKRTRVRAVGTVGGVAGGAGGAMGGFALGTMFLPGIGSAVGGIIGGIAGGFTGDLLASSVYGQMDDTVANMRKESR